jgi:hypothetical protein
VALDGNVAGSTKRKAKAEALVSTYRARRVSDRGFAVGAVFKIARPRRRHHKNKRSGTIGLALKEMAAT